METGKPGLASAPVHISSVAAQMEKRMDIQAPLTTVYIHTVPALPAQPYIQPPAAAREPATLHLAMPSLYSKETPPFLTLHIAGGMQSQPGLSLAAAPPTTRPKSAGKHMCPHCGRDCMKPSVLEKHLRCHTGERPYPCITCGVSFKTQSNLYKHKRTQAHARLSSESELSSLDSMSSSRETCSSSLSLEELGSMEKDAAQSAPEITCPASPPKVCSVTMRGSVSEQNTLTPAGQQTEANETAKVTTEGGIQRIENKKPLATASRHLTLQRQEATLFSKQWENSVSRGKSQSHESTDSGFSESNDHFPSPGSILPDHSMDSLTESTKERLEETTSAQTPSGPGMGEQEPKYTAREQEQKTLEERISKLISENTAVVEDKQLENVRPRKTVLSKQGSIDLPMPYTYKDSFHFDMRIRKTPNVGLHRNKRPEFYSSVPTQQSNTMEHAPLTRSNSLPFSVTLLQPERSSPTSSYQSDYVTLVRRGSSGQINPTDFAIKSVNQHSSTHRPLVRQTAVDGNHATDGLFVNSSVEEACASSLSCDGDGGDICGEPSNRKFRRKKAKKFAYNKWYMYGGGTFKKLYNAEKGGDDSGIKGRKCPTNPEHEVVQGLPKRLPAVHKETGTTTGSTVNFTSSSATMCRPGCPPAKLSLVSAVDFKLKTIQLPTLCSSLKTPLQRNLSVPLPLSSIGSLVSHQTDNMSGTEAGRVIDERKHSVPRAVHIPSDRKKQKTDDKIICPQEMETVPNTPTPPLPSATGSKPQLDTNLSYINLKKNQKEVLFPTCIINVSCLPATFTASTAKANFLPKYQLKLPNAAEPEPHVVDKLSGTDGRTSTSEQTSPLVKMSEKKCSDPVTSPLMQMHDIKKTFSSTQDQLFTPCTDITVCQAEASRLNPSATSSLAIVHRQFAATTVTTTCLQNYKAGLCSTSIQPSKPAGGSVPLQLPRPVAPVVMHFPATPIITTANNQTSAATVTAFSQANTNAPLPQISPESANLSPANNTYTKAPVVPCHIAPFDKMQPDAQNVFHVHTADLQICLQIISDEQLALIEPQIERQSGCTLSQRCDVEAVALEVIQNTAQSPIPMENSNDGRDHQHPGNQQKLYQSESLPTLNTERIKPPLFVPNLHHSISTQATASAESTPPELLGPLLRPHKCGHVNTVTVTQSSTDDVMSTAASLKGVKSGRRQTLEEEHNLLADRRVSQGGLISETHSSQHKLSVTFLSPGTVNHSTGSETLGKESKFKSQASAYNSSRLEGGQTHAPLQVGLSPASGTACADELSGSVSSFSISKCKASRQVNPQASVYCSNPVESTLPDDVNASNHANMGCDRAGPSDHSAPSGLMEGASLAGCAAQTVQKTLGHGDRETPVQPDWRLKQIQEAGGSTLHCTEGQGGRELVGENENGGIKTDEMPGRWDKAKSDCTYTGLSDMTKREGEDRKVKVDSLQNSWLSEQHLSQKHSGMSEYPPQSPQQAPSKSSSLNSSACSSQTSLLNSPQPLLEMNNFYFSQQHWESGINHNQQTQTSSECNSSHMPHIDSHIKVNAQLTEIQNAFSQVQSSSQQTQTFSHQGQKQSSIAPVQPEHTAAGNKITAVSCCTELISGSHKSPSVSPDVNASPSAHPSQLSYSVQVSRAAAGLTGETQAPNNDVLDNNNTVLPSEPFTYPEPDHYHDNKDKAPNDYNKYEAFFLPGQLHGYQPAECLSSGVRPVQSCQDYTEDTSSSDDEGKLIIEL